MATRSLLEFYLGGKDYDQWIRKCLGIEEAGNEECSVGATRLATTQIPEPLKEKYLPPIKDVLLMHPKVSSQEEISDDLEFIIEKTTKTFSLLGYQVIKNSEEDVRKLGYLESKSFLVQGKDVSLKGKISVGYKWLSPQEVSFYWICFYKV